MVFDLSLSGRSHQVFLVSVAVVFFILLVVTPVKVIDGIFVLYVVVTLVKVIDGIFIRMWSLPQ
jgi:hypothetical protein